MIVTVISYAMLAWCVVSLGVLALHWRALKDRMVSVKPWVGVSYLVVVMWFLALHLS